VRLHRLAALPVLLALVGVVPPGNAAAAVPPGPAAVARAGTQVSDLRALPAVGGVRLTWSPAPGSAATSSYVVDRRAGSAPWQRLADTSTRSYGDAAAPSGVDLTYRVTPVGSAGEDPTGAAVSAVVRPLPAVGPPAGAMSYASVDGGPLLSGQSVVADSSAVTLRLPGPDGPLVRVWPSGGEWTTGTYPGQGYRQEDPFSGAESLAGTWTVTAALLRPDGTPVTLSALFDGSRSTPLGPVPVRLIVVQAGVATGLPPYVITAPAVLTWTLPAGSDQSLPVGLRNVGGTTAVLDAVSVSSIRADPPQPTPYRVGRACLGVALPAGGVCSTSIRAVQDAGTSLFALGQATWTGPGGLAARVELRGAPPDPAVAPQVSPPRVNSVWRGAIVLDVDSVDPQPGQQVQLHCRVDSGAFTTACGSQWYLARLAGGAHTVTVYGTDPDGNMSDWQRLTFTVPGSTGRDLLAVTGRDAQLHSTTDVRRPLLPQGGRLVGGPALAVAGSEVYTVGVGADRALYVRSRTRGWRRLGPAGTRCTGPSVAISGRTMAVACRGADGHLRVGKAVLPAAGLPAIARFKDRGGALLHGPVASQRDGVFTYEVVGTDHAVWSTGDSGGWRELAGGLRCYGPPGTDSLDGNGLACRSRSGSLQLVLARGNEPVDVGGQVVGRPGLAVDVDGTTRSYVLGTDGRTHVAWTSPARTSSAWRTVPGGEGRYGVSAGHAAR